MDMAAETGKGETEKTLQKKSQILSQQIMALFAKGKIAEAQAITTEMQTVMAKLLKLQASANKMPRHKETPKTTKDEGNRLKLTWLGCFPMLTVYKYKMLVNVRFSSSLAWVSCFVHIRVMGSFLLALFLLCDPTHGSFAKPTSLTLRDLDTHQNYSAGINARDKQQMFVAFACMRSCFVIVRVLCLFCYIFAFPVSNFVLLCVLRLCFANVSCRRDPNLVSKRTQSTIKANQLKMEKILH